MPAQIPPLMSPHRPDLGPDLGAAALRAAHRADRGIFLMAALFGVVFNLLMLAPSFYMLLVYDRVLVSGSAPSLLTLSVLLGFLFVVMGCLDHSRNRLLARIGARVQARLERPVLAAALARQRSHPADPLPAQAGRALDALQRFWSTPVAVAMLDLPWVAFFLAALYLLHPALGGMAACAGALLVGVTLLQQLVVAGPSLRARHLAFRTETAAQGLSAAADDLSAMGIENRAFHRWLHARAPARLAQLDSTDLTGLFAGLSRMLRLGFQSAILGLGAWLVLQGALSTGAMIAGSILMGRGLTPIEQLITQWPVLLSATEGRRRIIRLLDLHPPRPRAAVPLPPPSGPLQLHGVSVMRDGNPRPLLQQISLTLQPGEMLGIMGESGAGKSTLARVMVGLQPVLAGRVLLGNHALGHYAADNLGRAIGYLPQNSQLLPLSLAENISRLDPAADAQAVMQAASLVGCHDPVNRLPQGWQTPAGAGLALSRGALQRLALARAYYGRPHLLVLDEPETHLDQQGLGDLLQALDQLRAAGHLVVVISHQDRILQRCDQLLWLEAGQIKALAPPVPVLRQAAWQGAA